eukprot:6164489-Amphidinium_carterae.1
MDLDKVFAEKRGKLQRTRMGLLEMQCRVVKYMQQCYRYAHINMALHEGCSQGCESRGLPSKVGRLERQLVLDRIGCNSGQNISSFSAQNATNHQVFYTGRAESTDSNSKAAVRAVPRCGASREQQSDTQNKVKLNMCG